MIFHTTEEPTHQQHFAEQEFYFPGHDQAIPTHTYDYTPGEEKPAVVILHDIFGTRAFYRDMARRLAGQGFTVLLPDLFHREGALTVQTPEAASARLKKHSQAAALHDLLALTDLLHNENRKIGVLGFCVGGRYALFAASHIPQIKACVVYYPMLVIQGTGHHPLAEIERVHAPVLGFVGEKDKVVPLKDVHEYEEAAHKANKQVHFTLYPELGYAFMTFGNEGASVHASQESWSRTLAFFKSHLK